MKTNNKRTAKKLNGAAKGDNVTSTDDITNVLTERPKLSEEINPSINPDETNDFDLTPEKSPALSTMQHNLKNLDKRLATTVPVGNFVQQFDKLKIAIDLRHWEAINFDFDIDTSNMFKCTDPQKPDTLADEEKRIQERYEELMEEYENPHLATNRSIDAIPEFEDLDEFSDDDADLEEETEEEFGETEEEKETLGSSSHRLNVRHFPNCKISHSSRTRNRTRGLNNVYIKSGYLYICVTGKFMRTRESLGYITRNNIIEVLGKVQECAGFSFNATSFLQRAVVYICHLCIDLISLDIAKDIDALSSLFPLASNKHVTRKYGMHGLQLKSKAKNAGSSLVFYNKLVEIENYLKHLLRKINIESLDNPMTLGQLRVRYGYPENLDKILRVELQIYKLQEMRALLGIPEREPYKVYLTDVLNSTATPILKRFEAFEATEEILRDKIALYVENEKQPKTEIKTHRKLKDHLAGACIALLLQDNGFDIRRVKSHLRVEYDINDTALYNNLITYIKNNLWNFLLHKKPKAIKRVLDILDKVHAYYGRGANNE